MTDLILDMENIDAVLGFSILQHKPLPYERPDFNLLLPSLRKELDAPIAGKAVLREGEGKAEVPRRKFAVFLERIGIRVIWAETTARRLGIPVRKDVVDDVIDHTLRNCRAGTVIVATHDGHVAEPLQILKENGARIGIIGFSEFVSNRSAWVADFLFDLEFDLGVFTKPLPRLQPF